MILNFQPKQFLLLYNCIKNNENHFRDREEEEIFISVKKAMEDAIVGAFESLESKDLSTGFDKWIKSETNKIQGLQAELDKLKETVPQEVLINKLKPVKKDVPVKIGRPKKNK